MSPIDIFDEYQIEFESWCQSIKPIPVLDNDQSKSEDTKGSE